MVLDALNELEPLLGPTAEEIGVRNHIRPLREFARRLPTMDYSHQYRGARDPVITFGAKRAGSPELALFRTLIDIARLSRFTLEKAKPIGQAVMRVAVGKAATWTPDTLETYYRESRRGIPKVKAVDSPLLDTLEDFAAALEKCGVEVELPLEAPRTRRSGRKIGRA
jgi:hypothetical protein